MKHALSHSQAIYANSLNTHVNTITNLVDIVTVGSVDDEVDEGTEGTEEDHFTTDT